MKILTFDIEEWFHILDHETTKTEKDWLNYESRIQRNMDIIFNFLDYKKLKATFFVVGWIAKKYPKIIKKIDDYGFEIGSHTHMHQLMFEQSKKDVYSDLEQSIKIIQDLTSKKVKYFRAPGFSITEKNKWVFQTLYDLGIEIDCSIFPAGRAHGGLPSFKKAMPVKIRYNSAIIKEFPINTYSLKFKKIIFSGGGYFRLFPYQLIKYFTKNTDYVMSYFHPRDFDCGQPVLDDLSMLRKFKSYYGIKGCLKKLEKWVDDFEFIDLKEADSLVDWDTTDQINL